ncbi:MAG: hypothetical protein Q8S33_10505 [Myxococcales bacterium]|nr:hypothetical protein [Myxococcales bacterium]
MRARLTTLVVAAGWLCLIAGFAWVPWAMQREGRHHGDLLAYHAAGRALAEGLDPNDPQTLARFGASTPFVYSPFSRPWALLLARLDWDTLQRAWLAAKGLALLGLAFVWRAWFRHQPLTFGLTLVLSLVGFRLALRVDLMAGNIAVFEALFVWLALVQWRASRPVAFVGLLSLAGAFKVAPLALLVVLRRHAVLAAAAMAIMLGVAWAFAPASWSTFVVNAMALDERGPQNPTLLSWLRDTVGVGGAATAGWAVFAALVIGVTAAAVRRQPGHELSAGLILLAWSLALPRFKDYSYVIVLPAAAQALVATGLRRWPLTLGMVVLLCVPLHPYQRLAAALMAWAVLTFEAFRVDGARLEAHGG